MKENYVFISKFKGVWAASLNFLKSFTFRSVESLVAVLLALAFFGIFLGFLNLLFPSGSDMMTEGKKRGGLLDVGFTGESVRDLVLNQGEEDFAFGPESSIAAYISAKKNKVKSKRADEIFWRKAETGLALHDRDAVQTHRRSSATIQLDEGNFLELGENSLIIIRRIQKDPILNEKRSLLVMFEGELRGRISPTPESGVHFEVATKSLVATIRSRDFTQGPTDFKIRIEPDQTSVISVFNGEAEVSAQGKTVEIRQNQGATVKPGQAPFVPESLPSPPLLDEPGLGEEFYFRDLPPRVRFIWKVQHASDAYRLVLAKDRDFEKILLDETVEETRFIHGNLKEGTYFWKVTTLRDKKEGLASTIGNFEIIRRTTPPALDVAFPPDTVKEEGFTLTGSTDPGAVIRIGGESIPTDSVGKFKHPITFERGINIVVVEAVDSAGNVAYKSKMVNGKF